MGTTSLQAKVFQVRYILLIPLLGVIFFIIAISIINPVEYPNSDFFTFWLSGRLVELGQNPYDSQIWVAEHYQYGATWISDTTFIYPLPLSLLFFPLGALPLYQAYIVWVILSQFMIITSTALLFIINSRSVPSLKHFILPIGMAVILYRPTIISLLNGQLSGMLLLILTSVIYLWEKDKWPQGAFLLAILALKPSLGIPIIGLVSVYLFLQRKISSLIALTASGLLLIFIGLAQSPNWVIEYWNVGSSKLSQTFGHSPTIWGITNSFCSYSLPCTIGYGMVISLLFLIGYLYLVVKKRDILSPSLVVGLAVTITLLLTPYIWSYDQLLLIIPITTSVLLLAKHGYKYLPVALLFLVIDILIFIILAGISIKIKAEIWNVSIPLITFCLLVWVLPKNNGGLPAGKNDLLKQTIRGTSERDTAVDG